MTSEFIGVIRNANDGVIYAVVNPDDDSELDDPRYLLLRTVEKAAPMEMVKIPRDKYMQAKSMEGVAKLIEYVKSAVER